MHCKKITSSILLFVLLLSLFTGCKSAAPEEEGAAVDSYVESVQQELSGDAPEKVEGNTNNSTQQGPVSGNVGSSTADPDAPVSNLPTTQEPTTQSPTAGDSTEGGEGESSVPGNPGTAEPSEPETDPALQDVDAGNFIKIIAYNIRCADDGVGNMIADRAPRFKMLVEELDADILALSEASEPWIKYLQQNIEGSKYKMLYKYRAESNHEAQPLLFDQTKFELLDDGYVWLSETPEVESKGWGDGYYRGATWAKLKVKATGKEFLYYSTHLSGSEACVTGSYRVIEAHAEKLGGFSKFPVIVSGDFNTRPWSAGYTEFAASFNDFNDYLGFDQSCTVHGYYGDRTEDGYIIDYVFGSFDNVVPTHYEVLNRKYLDGYISDHRGIYAECYIK